MPAKTATSEFIERELHNISLKLNVMSSLNEAYTVLMTLLSVFLTLLVSYLSISKMMIGDLLNLWIFSWGTVFFIWEAKPILEKLLKSLLKKHNVHSNGVNTNIKSFQSFQNDTYSLERFWKNVYSGIKSFSILSTVSLGAYLVVFLTSEIAVDWKLLIFLGILASMSIWDEQKLISNFINIFTRLAKVANKPLIHHFDYREKPQGIKTEETIGFNTIIGIFLGLGSIIILIIESILAPIKLIRYSSTLSLWIPILLVSFQYVLVWALMCAINKNQIHRDLANALICLQNLQYKLSSGDNVTMERVASCVKYTHFLKLTPLMVLEFYFYISHPIYERILVSPEEISESETN